MKTILIGLIIGIVLSGIAFFLMMPGMKQTAYDSGYSNGNKAGISAGITTGIGQGVAQVKAEQQHERDSVANAEKSKVEAMAKMARKQRKVVKEVQNWHVIDGKIAEPITE